jgi:hypothetical protein
MSNKKEKTKSSTKKRALVSQSINKLVESIYKDLAVAVAVATRVCFFSPNDAAATVTTNAVSFRSPHQHVIYDRVSVLTHKTINWKINRRFLLAA